MKILVIGSGGREHAIGWKAAQSNLVEKIFVAPGNAGTAMEPKLENIAIEATDIGALVKFVGQEKVELTIIGPEAPLVTGITDAFKEAGLRCFGPSKMASQLEGSKVFTKDFLHRHDIPTADYRIFTEIEQASAYIRTKDSPIIVKADGLAAGKGVIIAQSQKEAIDAAEGMLSGNSFGEAGRRVVVEEFLRGEETSFIVMVDGQHILPLATSQDHKAINNGDTGPNTGGMGAYSPAPVVTPEIYDRIMKEVIEPTVNGMALEGYPYIGFLYAGLMIQSDSTPMVLEYNCRFGDPETQVVLPLLKTDLSEIMMAVVGQKLASIGKLSWRREAAACVVMASKGYPGKYTTGLKITGLPIKNDNNCQVFHAGTSMKNNLWKTSGGRVLGVTGIDRTLQLALNRAYRTINKIRFEGARYRKDIGFRILRPQRDQ